MASHFLFLGLFMISCSVVLATQLYQDFCVADLKSLVQINGVVCKDPKSVVANDFFFSGLNIPGNTSTPIKAATTPVFVPQIPGLNSLDISMIRFDFALGGIIPPHIHPRASELVTVLEGNVQVGFNTTTNQLFTKVLQKGDVFVFPQGLIHFLKNVGRDNAVVLGAFSSQNPGVVIIPNA